MKEILKRFKETIGDIENKGVIFLIMISVVVNIIGFLSISVRQYQLASIPMEGEIELQKNVCVHAFKSMAEGSPIKSVLANETYEFIVANKENIDIEIKDLVDVRIDKQKCKVVIQDSTGMRAFLATLESSNDYPFSYVVSDIAEIPTTNEEEGV